MADVSSEDPELPAAGEVAATPAKTGQLEQSQEYRSRSEASEKLVTTHGSGAMIRQHTAQMPTMEKMEKIRDGSHA